MKRRAQFLSLCTMTLVVAAVTASGPKTAQAQALQSNFELWVLDQSDTAPESGGTLHIFQGRALVGAIEGTAKGEVIDLGTEVRELALTQTGTAPRRPHMMAFNTAGTHAIISFVATGHVLFMDAAARKPLAVIDVGAQAHAAFASPDDRFVLVANQNGKLLQRIRTDYATNRFVLESDATLDLAHGTTPSGAPREAAAVRPDNAPIWPLIYPDNRFTLVTLRGGGAFVVDATQTPMAIVAEYDSATIRPNGLLGTIANGKAYINSGGGTTAVPHAADLYSLPLGGFSETPSAPNTPAPKLVFSHSDRGAVDSHGAAPVAGGRYLWVADRAANLIIVVDTQTDQIIREITLKGTVSGDPAPDLLVPTPDGRLVFTTFRGPTPLTGNNAHHHNAAGTSPGVGIIRVDDGGKAGTLVSRIPLSRTVNDAEAADPHGIALRVK